MSNKDVMEIDSDIEEPTEKQNEQPVQKDVNMWVEKYRPNSLSDLIAHEDIVETIRKLVKENKLPHLLFYGPPGTGKTSTILAIAKEIYGKSYHNYVMELNASDERGINVIREQIKEFASTRRIFSTGFKLIILDEADHMTRDAQAALRRVIEKYTNNTRFCLIGNYVNKIIPALQSRCTRFRFGPLKKKQVISRLQEISNKENVNVTKEGLEAIYRLSGGDMRKCLNILQSVSLACDEVNEDNVYLCTGNPLRKDMQQMIQWMLNEDFTSAYSKIHKLVIEKGLALQDILRELANNWILRLKIAENVKMFLMKKLADVEYRVSTSTTETVQLASIIGIFQIAREVIVEGDEMTFEKLLKPGSIGEY